MKKNLLLLSAIAIIVAGVSTLSCTKLEQDGFTDNPSSVKGLNYTISMNRGESTKALVVSGSNLSKTFAEGETIAVVYISGDVKKVAISEALTSGDIKREGKYASFSVTLDAAPDPNSAVQYIYPSAMATIDGNIDYDALAIQNGTLASIASNLDLGLYSGTLTGTSFPQNMTLSNPLAICKFTIKNSGGTDITENVTRLTFKNGSDIYTIDPASSMSEIWAAIKPVTTGDITVYAACGKDLYKKTVSDITLENSNLYPINVTTTKVSNAISGLFRIDDNLIYFSKGNVRARYSFIYEPFVFADNQYDYAGISAISANTDITGNGTVSTGGYVDLFGWSTSSTVYGIHNGNTNSQYSGDFVDWSGKVNGSWHTPSRNEWEKICNHTHGKATVNGVRGVVFIPYRTSIEGFNTANKSYSNNTYDTSQWADMEALGAIFLPAAGRRSGANVYDIYDPYKGYYWSSDSYDSSWSYYMGFGADSGPSVGYSGRASGYSVRLIGE